MGIVGLLAGFLVMGVLIYLNWDILISAFIGAIVVIVTNSLPLASTLTEVYFPGMGSFLGQYFGMFLFGAILAELYSSSGAALTIAISISNALFWR